MTLNTRARMRALAIAALVVLLVVPAGAHAFSWEEPTRISDPGSEERGPWREVDAAMNGAGVIEALWDSNDLINSLPNHVLSARRAATGGWSAQEKVAGEIAGTSFSYGLVDVEIEPDGDAVAILGGLDGIYASLKKAGGSWSEPMLAIPSTGGEVDNRYGNPTLVLDGNGNASLFYGFRIAGSVAEIRRSDWDTNDPTSDWEHTTIAGPSSNVALQSADMSDSGAGIALFKGDDFHLYAVTKTTTGSWTAPTPLTTGDTWTYQAATGGVDQNGNAHVIIQGCPHESDHCLWEAKKPATGAWSALTELPHYYDYTGAFAQVSSMYIAPDGNAIITLSRIVLGGDTEWASMAYSGSSWSAPVELPIDSFPGGHIRAVIDSSGNEHVAFSLPDTSNGGTVWATRRTAGAATTYSEPQLLGTNPQNWGVPRLHDLMIDADGEPAVVFQIQWELQSSRGGDFPKAGVSPTSVDFGSLQVGSPASTRTVTLTNTGDALLDVSGVQLNGPFTHNNPDCLGDDLGPGQSCEIVLSFQATDTSAKNGSLVFTHNAAGNPTTVPLTGSGHNPAGSPQLNASELQFGTRRVGTVFPEDGFQGIPATLTNAGPGPIHISTVTVPAPFEATNPVGCDNVTLPANHSCTVFVRFRPTQVGEFVEELSFVTDDVASPHRFTLRGNGIPAPDAGGDGGDQGDAGGDGGDQGDAGGDHKQPSPAEAGTSDAKKAASAVPSSVSGSAFQKNGLGIPINITLAPAQVNGQADGIIATGGGNLLGQAGTNIIASDGASLLGQGATNLLGQAGTNKRALRSAQSSATVKCPSKVLKKNKKAKCKRVVLISGNVFLPLPGPATLTVKPTAAFNKALKQAIARAKAQKKKGKKGKKGTPFKLAFATIVRPGGPTAPGYYQPKTLTIKP